MIVRFCTYGARLYETTLFVAFNITHSIHGPGGVRHFSFGSRRSWQRVSLQRLVGKLWHFGHYELLHVTNNSLERPPAWRIGLKTVVCWLLIGAMFEDVAQKRVLLLLEVRSELLQFRDIYLQSRTARNENWAANKP
jgi:hypothetical protein